MRPIRFLSCTRLSLIALGLLGVTACDSPGDESATLGVATEPLQNGTPVNEENSGFPRLVTSAGLGSAVLLSNTWALTAAHCGAVPGTVLTMGSQQQSVSRVVNHPDGTDVALVQLSSPFAMNGSTTGYYRLWDARDPSQLVGQSVTCYGYGRTDPSVVSSGTLHSGTGVVAAAGPRYMALNNPSGQVVLPGDSGGGCVVSSTIGPALVMGIAGAGAVNNVQYPSMGAAVGNIDRWLMETMYPNRDLWCHGTECMTTKPQLALRTTLPTGWLPCKGRPLQWLAYLYLQDSSKDFFEVNSVRFTNTGYIGSAGTLPAGTPLTMTLVTNDTVNSRGVSFMIATCQ